MLNIFPMGNTNFSLWGMGNLKTNIPQYSPQWGILGINPILIIKKSYFAQFRSSNWKFDEIEIRQFEGFSTFDFLSLQLPLLKTFVFLHCPIWHKLEFQRGFHWHVKARMIGKWWVVGKNKSWWCWHLFFGLFKIKSGGENKMGLLSQPYWNRQEG